MQAYDEIKHCEMVTSHYKGELHGQIIGSLSGYIFQQTKTKVNNFRPDLLKFTKILTRPTRGSTRLVDILN